MGPGAVAVDLRTHRASVTATAREGVGATNT